MSTNLSATITRSPVGTSRVRRRSRRRGIAAFAWRRRSGALPAPSVFVVSPPSGAHFRSVEPCTELPARGRPARRRGTGSRTEGHPGPPHLAYPLRPGWPRAFNNSDAPPPSGASAQRLAAGSGFVLSAAAYAAVHIQVAASRSNPANVPLVVAFLEASPRCRSSAYESDPWISP